jgi:rare lipoprotein A (peptidoglycan hydrolase)
VALAAAAAGALVGSGARARWRKGVASVYSQYGTELACGGRLEAGRVGVAHRTLPCGAQLAFRHAGHTLTVPVIDRGPYVAGRDFDLTPAAAAQLGVGGVATVEWHR